MGALVQQNVKNIKQTIHSNRNNNHFLFISTILSQTQNTTRLLALLQLTSERKNIPNNEKIYFLGSCENSCLEMCDRSILFSDQC